MIIVRKREYSTALKAIILFISKNNKSRALGFKSQLDNKINNLVNFPYKFRKSYYHNDKNIRDLVFKGYTVPYLIDKESSKIVLLDIFKWSNR
jgi:plasmid stabilization system protein ParE